MADSEIIVVGGGAAGLTAGMHTARLGYQTTIVERLFPCSRIMNAERIDNFPGFTEPVSGADLTAYLTEQAINAGVKIVSADAQRLEVHTDAVSLRDTAGGVHRCKAIILSMGSSLKKLCLPNEHELQGRGISECASCDGPLFEGKSVVVIGGGDSAVDEALTLSRYAKSVTVLCRGNQLRAHAALVDQMKKRSNIIPRFGIHVTKLLGDTELTSVEAVNAVSGELERLEAQGMFVFIGLQPNTNWVRGTVDLISSGHIMVNQDMSTTAARVFAAGDVRNASAAQLASVSGDGATAALSVHRMLQKN